MGPFKKILSILILLTVLFSCTSGLGDDTDFGDPPTPESCFCHPDGVKTYLNWIWSNYPEITDLRVVGQSETGRDIYALEISDNPGYSEDEPAVLINGGIHGHEQIGVGIPMKMIEYIVQAYEMGNQEAVYLVENFKLHFMPTINPDGLYESDRYNDNWVDLNRNFDYHWDSEDSYAGEAPFDQSESAAIRDDFDIYGYCLSLNLHTSFSWGTTGNTDGGVGIYAPWDAIESNEDNGNSFIEDYLPNYIFIKGIGETYADSVVDSEEYPFDYYFHYQEGADWYPFGGSMADWALGTHGTVSYSIEIYGDQYFTTDDSYLLESTWNANKEALMEILLSAELGTGGIVKDSSGNIVMNAEIKLHNDNPPSSRSITPVDYPDLKAKTDSNGRFRLLTGDGSYEITIDKSGYMSTITDQSLVISTTQSRGLTTTGGSTDTFYPVYTLTEE